MSTPPCPVCGQPLRWLLDQNMWSCDRCRQTFPFNRMGAGPPRGRSKTPFIVGGGLLGAGLVAGIVVAATRGGDDKAAGAGSGSTTAPAPTAPAPTAPTPPPAPTAPAPPAEPNTGVAQCDDVVRAVRRVKACAAMDRETVTSVEQMADNDLGAIKGLAPADIDENAARRCASTSSYAEERLREASCAEVERLEAKDYSLIVPAGWSVPRVDAARPNELAMEERLAAVGRSTRSRLEVDLVAYEEYADASASAEACQKLGELLAKRYPSTTLDKAEVTTARLGRACRTTMHDNDVQRLGWSINVGGKHILRTSCIYEGSLPSPPPACTKVLEGLVVGPLPVPAPPDDGGVPAAAVDGGTAPAPAPAP